MGEHRYEIPDEVDNAWNNVSEQAQRVLGTTALGKDSHANQLLTSETAVDSEVYSWLLQELQFGPNGSVFDGWKKHQSFVGTKVPKSIEVLAQGHPTFAQTVTRLYNARQSLLALDEKADDNIVGQDMKLILMPWLAMSKAIKKVKWEDWADDCYAAVTGDDATMFEYFEPIRDALSDNQKIYRNPDNPAKLLTPKAYLKMKLLTDGPWGIMLVQTGNYPGQMRYGGKSTKELTKQGKEHLYLEGHIVDALGIFEWWALSLQVADPKSLSSGSERSLLLANLLMREGDKYCLSAGWYNAEKESYIDADPYDKYDTGSHDLMPRLAVA